MKQKTVQIYQDCYTGADNVLAQAIAKVRKSQTVPHKYTAHIGAIHPGDRDGRWMEINVFYSINPVN
jgi:hypothetical protein